MAAMNSSWFQPYCCDGDAGKIAPVQTIEAKPLCRETHSYTRCRHPAHYQTNLCAQNTVAEPTMLDSVELGWHKDNNGASIPIVSDVSPAPEAFAELIKCSNAVRYSCKAHIMIYIHLWKCEAAN